MKKLLMLFLLSLSISCKESVTEHPSIRRIVNETGFDVLVEVFGDETNKFTYNIMAHDSIDIEGFCTSGIETYCSLGWHTSLAFGSIYFDNNKVQHFQSPSSNRSEKFINADPIGEEYGYVSLNINGVWVYTYRITQEDYKNAEDIGG